MFSEHICLDCDGKGYHWQLNGAIQTPEGKRIARTYKTGDRCATCKGTGRHSDKLSTNTKLCLALIIFIAIYFMLQFAR